MPVEQVRAERRRYVRLAVGGRLEGRIAAARKKAQVVDISRGGALVEHMTILPRQSVAFVTLFFPGNDIRLKCRAVRSQAHRYEVWPSGERCWVYRTGLEFLEAWGASPRVIGEYISDEAVEFLIKGDWIPKDFEEIP